MLQLIVRSGEQGVDVVVSCKDMNDPSLEGCDNLEVMLALLNADELAGMVEKVVDDLIKKVKP